MVRFVPELTTIEDLDQALKLENLEEDPLESKSYDYSFADGLLDFDSIKVWFENSTDLTPVMAADGEKVKVEEGLFSGEAQIGCGSSPIVDGMAPGPIGKVERVELEEEVGGLRGPSIVEGMEKFSLAAAGENGVKSEKMSDGEDKREDSSSSFSSSSSSSSSGDDEGDSDNDYNEKEEVRENEENVNVKRGVDDMVDDVEEGEIKDGNNDDDEEEDDEIVNVDQTVAWSDVDEDDEEDGSGAKAGPILSKNELSRFFHQFLQYS